MTGSKTFLDELLEINENMGSIQEKEDLVLAPLLDHINLIQNGDLKSFVRCVLCNVPAVFWTMPVHLEPDIHPLDEYKEGGLVLHTKRVVRAAMLLTEIQYRPQEELDLMIAAALLHDIMKADSNVPNYLHSIAVDRFIETLSVTDELDSEYQTRSNTLSFIVNSPEQLIMLMRIIRAHEGTESPCPELIPVTSLEQILNAANQVARNIDKIVDGYEIKEFRWQDDPSTKDTEAEIITEQD